MAEASVTEAIYKLRYEGGDSVRTLTSIRQAAEQAAQGTDKLATSEERLGKSSLNMLAALDPRIRAEQAAARQLEHFNRLHLDGAITNDRYAQTLRMIEGNLKTKIAATDGAIFSTARLSDNVGLLIGRYASWAAIITTVTKLARTAAEHDEEAGNAIDRLSVSWVKLSEAAAPTLTFLVNRLTNVLDLLNAMPAALADVRRGMSQAEFLGRDTANPLLSQRSSGIPFASAANPFAAMDSKSRNWTPGAAGFPVSGSSDLTAIAAAQKKLTDEALKGYAAEADAIFKLSQARAEMYEKWRIAEEKRHATFDANIKAEITALGKAGLQIEIERNKAEEGALQSALEYGEKLSAEMTASERKRTDDFIKDQERAFDQAAEYWRDVSDSMLATGRDFWLEWAQTGVANIKDLFGKLKAWFAQLLWDLAIEAKLRPIALNITSAMGGGILGAAGGLFGGGGSYNGVPMSVPVTPMAGSFWSSTGFGGKYVQPGLMGAGVGSIVGSLTGGNSMGSAIGGGAGGIAGSIIGSLIPGIGTVLGGLLGGALGGGIGGMFGGKPSDMRSVATFTPGMTDFGVSAQSAHETSQATLSAAQQAASAISQEVQALTAFGVQFTQQLSNIWIGERDASTFQLQGGQRISVGTVGDVADLTADTIAALLKQATSSDPEIAAILKAGGTGAAITQALQALQTARAFSSEIEMALLAVTDPLKYAIELWKKESQARLDMAAAYGVSLDTVQQLNAALYQQIAAQQAQQNAGAISGLDQFINSLQYGAGSAASPQAQIGAAFSDYDAARQAALMNPSAQTAAAFQQAAGSFLPLAREFYGTTQTYDAFAQGAINTAEQLKGFLGTPAMPDLAPVIQQTSAMSTAAIVEATQTQTDEIVELKEEVRQMNGMIFSLLRQVAG